MYSKLNIEGLENQIEDKYQVLEPIFREIKREQESNPEIDLSDAEKEAIKYSVTEFMYYNVKYCTGMLSAAEKKLIADCPGEGTEYYRNTYKTITSDNYTKYEYIDKLRTDERYYPQNQDAWLELLYTGMMLYNAKYYKTENTQSKSEEFGILKLARNFGTRGLDRYYQYDFPHIGGEETICLPGLQTILKKLAEKSLETGTDLLKYAYFKSGAIDEVQRSDFWGAYEALNASFVLESSKDEVEKSILNYDGSNELFKAQLLESLDNLHFMITNCSVDRKMIPYTNGYFHIDDAPAYFSMLANGLEYLGFDDLEDYYPRKRYTTDSHDENQTQIDYITVPKNHTIQCFCSLFNDFSPTMPPYCSPDAVSKDYDGAKKSLENTEQHIWWYNCMSEGNPLLAGFFIGGNTGYIKCEKKNGYSIQGNSLAIARANVWQQYAMGIEGELYWKIDDLIGEADWQKPNDYCNCTRLVYPLNPFKTKLENNTVKDKYGSFASCIRLENLSEATDDYDYLCYANQLINKCRIIEDDLDESVDLDSYVAKINKIYDTLFDDVNYDDNVTSEKITKAKSDLAGIIVSLQRLVRAKAYSFRVINCKSDVLYLRWDAVRDHKRPLTEYISIDFKNGKSSVGTMTKINDKNNECYEVIIPLDDMPMLNTQAYEREPANMNWYGYYDGGYDRGQVSLSLVYEKKTVDVVQPTRQYSYLKTEFWNQYFDESVKDWKNSGKACTFEFKPIDLIADTEREENTVTFYFNQSNPWKGTTKYYSLNVADGTVKIGDTTIQASKGEDGWYCLTVPFSVLDEREAAAVDYSIDMLEFRDIKHSCAIRNISVTKMASGDLNDDGILDKSDVTMLEAFLVGNGHLTLELWEEADYDHNGVLNVIDLTLMKRAIL